MSAAALPAGAQEPAPADIAASPLLRQGQIVQLTLAWRYRVGDDPAWASPSYDDRSWQTLEPATVTEGAATREAREVVWFRRHLRVARGLLGEPLALRVFSAGRVTTYVDGVSFGPFSPSGPPDVAAVERGPAIFTLASGTDHVLAVRYDGTVRGARTEGAGAPLFFLLSLSGPESILAGRAVTVRLGEAVAVAATTVPLFLAFLHLALYWFYPRARENLFYACCMFCFALIVFSGSAAPRLLTEQAAAAFSRLSPFGVFGAILFGLLTYYAARLPSLPRAWILFSVGALLFAVASSVFPARFWNWGWYLYFAATMVEIVRVARSAQPVERQGSRLLLWGLILLGAFVTLQVLINIGVVASLGGYREAYVLGMLALAVSMSLFLARTFAGTRLHLESRLKEVQALSSQVLEQERAAHRQELQRRLLVAENERKSHELEEARELQLSMLPAALPEVQGLDVAVAMTTATEVGGDYYDFRPDGNGLVVAIGDATGHGAASGTMVAAVKALFSSLGAAGGLPAAMQEYDRVLRSLNLKRMHMCLAVSRIAPRSVAVCCAGMPPALIRRAGSGAVEELGDGGLPLGGNLSPSYAESVADLAAGDTLLFASDGLSELLDPEGRSFGYERVAAVLREATVTSAQGVVDRMTEVAAAWRGERGQVDDITLVVIRVTR